MIQSIQRAFQLAEAIAATGLGGARLSDLAEATGLNRSTAHNILATLEALGYVEQKSKGSRYRVTARLARLAHSSAEGEQLLRARMRPVLERVAAEVGETSYLAFAIGNEYLCVDAVQSAEALRLAVTPGEREPLLGTAIGHALIAVDRSIADRLKAEKPAEWVSVADRVVQAQEDGFALDLEQYHLGVSCVAIDVGPGAAIGVAGPSSRLPEARLVEIAEIVRKALGAD